MTLGELLVRHGPPLATARVFSMPLVWHELPPTHWLAAKMSEPIAVWASPADYCRAVIAASNGGTLDPRLKPIEPTEIPVTDIWPNLGPGVFQNPYAQVDTKPELTPAQKGAQRAVDVMRRSSQ